MSHSTDAPPTYDQLLKTIWRLEKRRDDKKLLLCRGWVHAEGERVRALLVDRPLWERYRALLAEFDRVAIERRFDGRLRRYALAQEKLYQAAVALQTAKEAPVP